MKQRILVLTIALLASFAAAAQSTNPLNYSGRMYVEAIEIIATPRYVSYEDHAILSQQMRIPSVEVTACELDFEKSIITVDGKEMKVKVTKVQQYEVATGGWIVVLYMDMIGTNDKMELVWPHIGKPYLQQITKTDDSVNIARMILSFRPYKASEEETLMNLLRGLSTM